MGILLIIVGIAMTAMSLLLLLVYPWALIGIAIGVLEIVYGRKKWKASRAARAASKQQVVIPNAAEAPAEAAPAPAPAEMDAASKQHDLEPKPERTFSKMETHRIAGTSFHESEITDLLLENDDYDMTASELIDSGMEDERVYRYLEAYCDAALEPESDNQYDPNAVKVFADGIHIGYIKKGSAAHVKKLLEEDRIASMSINISGGPYKLAYLNEDDRPRIEKDDQNFSVKLDIFVK